jgi:hypothetical protein
VAFDFPNSPTTGQIYQPTGGPLWQYDGEKWKGGQVAGPQKEQFFDVSGLTQKDIPVPAWAKHCRITGSIFVSAAAYVQMRVSVDGSTFIAGASDYTNNAPTHTSTGQVFGSVAQATASAFILSSSADIATIPINFTTEINVARPSTSAILFVKSYSRVYLAASTLVTAWYGGWVNAAPMGSVLVAKALRILLNTGSFAAGSTLHVEWLGDDAQIPTQNAIPDAPSDGQKYVRRNGAWVVA